MVGVGFDFAERKTFMAKRKTTETRISRDAGTGKFIPVKEAERRKETAVVETIKKKTK